MENPSMQSERHRGFVSVSYARGSFAADRQANGQPLSFDVSRELQAPTRP